MFDFPNRMISPEEVITIYEVGTEEECDEIENMYNYVSKLIESSDDSDDEYKWMKITFNAHKNLIESRTDWTKCQKTVRRKRIISMMHNTMFKKSSEG